jgi:hypothetical protein
MYLENHLRAFSCASCTAEVVDGPCLVDERPCMDLGNMGIPKPPEASGPGKIFLNAWAWSNKDAEEQKRLQRQLMQSRLVRDLQEAYPLTSACWTTGRRVPKIRPPQSITTSVRHRQFAGRLCCQRR